MSALNALGGNETTATTQSTTPSAYGATSPLSPQSPPPAGAEVVIANTLRATAGAALKHWQFDFVSVSDSDAFNAIPNGGVAVDEIFHFTKVAGKRVYWAGDESIKLYVADLFNSIIPLRINASVEGASLPVAPFNANREIQFTGSGRIGGFDVQAGGTATLKDGVTLSDGEQLTWAHLNYNEAQSTAGQTVDLTELVRIDGSATHSAAATEKAVADVIRQQRAEVDATISDLATSVKNRNDSQDNVLSTLRGDLNDVKAQLPRQVSEFHIITDGQNPSFTQPLSNAFVEVPQLQYYVNDGQGGYSPISGIFNGGAVRKADGWEYNVYYSGPVAADTFGVRAIGMILPFAE